MDSLLPIIITLVAITIFVRFWRSTYCLSNPLLRITIIGVLGYVVGFGIRLILISLGVIQ